CSGRGGAAASSRLSSIMVCALGRQGCPRDRRAALAREIFFRGAKAPRAPGEYGASSRAVRSWHRVPLEQLARLRVLVVVEVDALDAPEQRVHLDRRLLRRPANAVTEERAAAERAIGVARAPVVGAEKRAGSVSARRRQRPVASQHAPLARPQPRLAL